MERDRRKLGRYRDKRSPGVTNEPFGDESTEPSAAPGPALGATESGAFVVHLHDATRRHYDVRLEVGGVLLSFAVPRGPSLDPKEKVLAVKTEDHPIEYLEFEDVIPDGQYGAGSMIAWDRGSVNYIEGPAEAELAVGKLHVELRGMKLRGRFAFVKLAKSATGADWLLFKKQDEHADPARDITNELPRSVLSGLTVEELERRDEIGEDLVLQAHARGAPRAPKSVGELRTSARCPLILEDPSPPKGRSGSVSSVSFDADLDGVRVLATREGDVVSLKRWSADAPATPEAIEDYYPDVVRALRALPVSRLALDGELVAFDASGRPSLQLLAERAGRIAGGEPLRAVTTTPVVLVVKDVLALGDADTRAIAIEQRRELIDVLLPSVGFLRASTPLEGDEAGVLASCASLGIASVVAKPKGSTYSPDTTRWTRLETGVAPRSRPARMPRHEATPDRNKQRHVVVSNREKVFWPDEPDGPKGVYTKGDLVDYYASIAELLLPYLVDRPIILVRYPDGIRGKSFYQWNVPVGMPAWVRTLTMNDVEDVGPASAVPSSKTRTTTASASAPPKTPKRGFLVDDPSTLVYIANLGCIPLHVLASRAPDLSRADFLTLDFDVKQSSLVHAITLAQTLHEILDAIGLEGLPKTSGQSGLHVLVPLGPGQSFDTARALADLLGRLLVERHADIATMERLVMKRGARVYVDTGQTGTSRAIVAPYSVRAVPGATVSTPLTWDEVTPELDPRAFTMRTVPPRVARRGDLLAGLLAARPNIPEAVTRLADLVAPRPP